MLMEEQNLQVSTTPSLRFSLSHFPYRPGNRFWLSLSVGSAAFAERHTHTHRSCLPTQADLPSNSASPDNRAIRLFLPRDSTT